MAIDAEVTSRSDRPHGAENCARTTVLTGRIARGEFNLGTVEPHPGFSGYFSIAEA